MDYLITTTVKYKINSVKLCCIVHVNYSKFDIIQKQKNLNRLAVYTGASAITVPPSKGPPRPLGLCFKRFCFFNVKFG